MVLTNEMRRNVYLIVFPEKLDFCLQSSSLLAWNVDIMVWMKQSYCDQKEKILMLRIAEQENKRFWALMMVTVLRTAYLCVCFMRKRSTYFGWASVSFR